MRVCQICFIQYEPKAKAHTQKYCSLACYKAAFNKASGRDLDNGHLAPTTIGAITEFVISVKLMQEGYAVFRALSPASFCDIVAIRPDRQPLYIECRTSNYRTKHGKPTYAKNLNGPANAFAVYQRDTGTIDFFDLKHLPLKI